MTAISNEHSASAATAAAAAKVRHVRSHDQFGTYYHRRASSSASSSPLLPASNSDGWTHQMDLAFSTIGHSFLASAQSARSSSSLISAVDAPSFPHRNVRHAAADSQQQQGDMTNRMQKSSLHGIESLIASFSFNPDPATVPGRTSPTPSSCLQGDDDRSSCRSAEEIDVEEELAEPLIAQDEPRDDLVKNDSPSQWENDAEEDANSPPLLWPYAPSTCPPSGRPIPIDEHLLRVLKAWDEEEAQMLDEMEAAAAQEQQRRELSRQQGGAASPSSDQTRQRPRTGVLTRKSDKKTGQKLSGLKKVLGGRSTLSSSSSHQQQQQQQQQSDSASPASTNGSATSSPTNSSLLSPSSTLSHAFSHAHGASPNSLSSSQRSRLPSSSTNVSSSTNASSLFSGSDFSSLSFGGGAAAASKYGGPPPLPIISGPSIPPTSFNSLDAAIMLSSSRDPSSHITTRGRASTDPEQRPSAYAFASHNPALLTPPSSHGDSNNGRTKMKPAKWFTRRPKTPEPPHTHPGSSEHSALLPPPLITEMPGRNASLFDGVPNALGFFPNANEPLSSPSSSGGRGDLIMRSRSVGHELMRRESNNNLAMPPTGILQRATALAPPQQQQQQQQQHQLFARPSSTPRATFAASTRSHDGSSTSVSSRGGKAGELSYVLQPRVSSSAASTFAVVFDYQTAKNRGRALWAHLEQVIPDFVPATAESGLPDELAELLMADYMMLYSLGAFDVNNPPRHDNAGNTSAPPMFHRRRPDTAQRSGLFIRQPPFEEDRQQSFATVQAMRNAAKEAERRASLASLGEFPPPPTRAFTSDAAVQAAATGGRQLSRPAGQSIRGQQILGSLLSKAARNQLPGLGLEDEEEDQEEDGEAQAVSRSLIDAHRQHIQSLGQVQKERLLAPVAIFEAQRLAAMFRCRALMQLAKLAKIGTDARKPAIATISLEEELGEAVTNEEDSLSSTIRNCLRQLEDEMPESEACLCLLEEGRVIPVVRGMNRAFEGQRLEINPTFLQHALLNRNEGIYILDTAADPRFAHLDHAPASVYARPVIDHHGLPIAWICLASKHAGVDQLQASAELFEQMAELISEAVFDANAREMMKERMDLRQVEDNFSSSISNLGFHKLDKAVLATSLRPQASQRETGGLSLMDEVEEVLEQEEMIDALQDNLLKSNIDVQNGLLPALFNAAVNHVYDALGANLVYLLRTRGSESSFAASRGMSLTEIGSFDLDHAAHTVSAGQPALLHHFLAVPSKRTRDALPWWIFVHGKPVYRAGCIVQVGHTSETILVILFTEASRILSCSEQRFVSTITAKLQKCLMQAAAVNDSNKASHFKHSRTPSRPRMRS